MDITQGILNFFRIFTILYEWMCVNTFIIGGIEFSYISLMWSIIALSIFVHFLFRFLD